MGSLSINNHPYILTLEPFNENAYAMTLGKTGKQLCNQSHKNSSENVAAKM